MSMLGIITAGAIVGGTGIVIGLFLGIAGEKFKVEVNEKEEAVRDLLPGNNCGGCGFPGCDGLAAAIAAGEAAVSACPVGGAETAEKISAVLGIEAEEMTPMTAFVRCGGSCGNTTQNYDYYGEADCSMLAYVPGGGPKSCTYGCSGFGNCVRVCPFDAIHVINGIAVVDKEACKACGKCVEACARGLITLVPADADYLVACHSSAKGKEVQRVCKNGCIGCKLCEKNCPASAVTVENNIALIDPEKCTGCGVCASKCPKGCILKMSPAAVSGGVL